MNQIIDSGCGIGQVGSWSTLGPWVMIWTQMAVMAWLQPPHPNANTDSETNLYPYHLPLQQHCQEMQLEQYSHITTTVSQEQYSHIVITVTLEQYSHIATTVQREQYSHNATTVTLEQYIHIATTVSLDQYSHIAPSEV